MQNEIFRANTTTQCRETQAGTRPEAQRRGSTRCGEEEKGLGVVQDGVQAGTGDPMAINNLSMVKDVQTWSRTKQILGVKKKAEKSI